MNYILIMLITILAIIMLAAWFFIKVTISALKLYMTCKRYSLPTSDEMGQCADTVLKYGLWKKTRR